MDLTGTDSVEFELPQVEKKFESAESINQSISGQII